MTTTIQIRQTKSGEFYARLGDTVYFTRDQQVGAVGVAREGDDWQHVGRIGDTSVYWPSEYMVCCECWQPYCNCSGHITQEQKRESLISYIEACEKE